MRTMCSWLLLLVLVVKAFTAGPIPSPTCPPGVKNCVPPSPPSATVAGEYPIEVTASLPKETWKKEPFGAPSVYTVSMAADSGASGTCNNPASITFDDYGRAQTCISASPSPAAGFYNYPANLLVSAEGTVQSVQNNASPTFENVTADVINSTTVLTPNDVLYYGAKCDGATDDTLAIQMALSAGKGLVRLPKGTCVIKPPAGSGGNALVLSSNTFLAGQGMGLSIIKCVPPLTALFGSCITFNNGTQNATLSQFTVKYDATAATGTTSFLVKIIASASRIVLSSVELDGSIVVTNANTTSHSVIGIRLSTSGTLSNVMFRNMEVHNVNFGFLQSNTDTPLISDLTVTDSWFHDNFNDDISFNAPASPSVSNLLITHNIVENNQGYRVGVNGIAVAYAGPGVGVLIDGNEISGVYGYNAIHLEQGPYEFVVSNNIMNIQGVGITLQWNNVSNALGTQPTHGVISGNIVRLTSRSLFYQSTLSDGINMVFDTLYLLGATPAVEVTLVDNVVSGQFARGITVATNPWQSVSLESNKVDGADTCYSMTGGSYLFTDNISANCSVGIAANYARIRNHAFYNVTSPTFVTGMWSAQNLIFELPRSSCSAGGFSIYNLLPVNSSVYLSMNAQIASRITTYATAASDTTSRIYTQLLYDGANFFAGPTSSLALGGQDGIIDVASGFLRAKLFCGAARDNISMEVTLAGYYAFGPGTAATAFSGTWTAPNLNARGYGYVGTSAPSATTVGDWTATRVFQGANQVLDTLTAGSGISITGSGNSRTISASSSGVTSLAGTAGQISVSAATGPVIISLPSTWSPTVSTMSITASGPQMRTYMDTNTEWGVYDNSISRSVLSYERNYRALTFGQRLMVEEEGTIGTSIQLFGGACNPSPFSFGGSVTLAGSQSVFKITLVTGSGTCASSSAAFQFLWTWTGANVVVCTATPQTSATIDVPLGVDASPTNFVGRVGSVPFNSGQTYVWNVMCVGTATQTVMEDENEE